MSDMGNTSDWVTCVRFFAYFSLSQPWPVIRSKTAFCCGLFVIGIVVSDGLDNLTRVCHPAPIPQRSTLNKQYLSCLYKKEKQRYYTVCILKYEKKGKGDKMLKGNNVNYWHTETFTEIHFNKVPLF
jgi:hypothetical protein